MTHTELINTVRIQNANRILTRVEIENLLRGIPYATTGTMVKTLVDYRVLTVVDAIGRKQFYKFVDRPVHHDKMENIINDIRSQYNIKESKDPIEEAIKLLKDNGYKIFKEI